MKKLRIYDVADVMLDSLEVIDPTIWLKTESLKNLDVVVNDLLNNNCSYYFKRLETFIMGDQPDNRVHLQIKAAKALENAKQFLMEDAYQSFLFNNKELSDDLGREITINFSPETRDLTIYVGDNKYDFELDFETVMEVFENKDSMINFVQYETGKSLSQELGVVKERY